MIGKTAVKRARTLEAWLRELIAAYQDRRLKPGDRAYSNLTRMPRPTQMYAITMKHGASNVGVVLITHRKDVGNGVTLAVRVNSIEELAELSGMADNYFGTGGLVREDQTGGRVFLPQLGVAEQACMTLAQLWRDRQRLPQLPPSSFKVPHKQAVQVSPPAALWRVRYRAPLPEPRRILLELESSRRRPTRAAAPAAVTTAQRKMPARATAYAAFPEPLIWFGVPPYPSPRDRILERPWLPTQEQRLLHRAVVGDVQTLVCNNGLILTVTDDRRVARSTMNQIFAVLTRSGVLSLALQDFELIEVSDLDEESGAMKGSQSVVTPRNRLLDVPTLDRPTRLSYSLPDAIVAPLLDLADRCATDRAQGVASLRLLNAFSLFHRQFFTEAFVTAWSLIETSMERDFVAFWVGRGRSKTTIDEMDWTASQQIDLLIAVSSVDPDLGEQIHSLRKRRNSIVHDLADATEQEALSCIEAASTMTPLPQFPEALKPQTVLL